MLASPMSPSMPSLEPMLAPILPPSTSAAAFSTDQPPALELYDSVDADADDADDEDDDDDDDSSDGKLPAEVNLSDDAEPADGQPQYGTVEGDEEEGEGEEEDEEDEEELPEPCPRFYIRIKQFGPYVNYNTLLKHTQHEHNQPTNHPTTAPLLTPSTPPTNQPTGTPPTAAAAADCATLHADAAVVPVSAADDASDVLIVGEGRTRRKRQSTQDEYDTNDPFIDDTELPQEREEEEMRTEIEGFHVQIGAVQVKEREVAVKQEQGGGGGGGADERRKKRQRQEWTKRQIAMSTAMTAQLDKIVAECQLVGGSEVLSGSHRRLPDELIELLVQLNDIYDTDSAARDSTERKVLRHNMLERLEAAMGQTRQAIRSRMKTAVQRHRRDQLDQQIRAYKQSLHKAAAHDYSDFHHRISTAPQPTATKGNVVVHKAADGQVERYEYRPRFSLWMEELLALAAAVVEAAGVQRGEDGRAIEAEGWKVEKDLWEEAAGWWGAGVMTGKLIGDRVKQARKDRRKKKAQHKQLTANTNDTPAHTSHTSIKPVEPAADKQGKSKEKEKASEKRKRDGGATTDKEREKKKKVKTDVKSTTKDSNKATDNTSHKHKSATAKPAKESSSKEKDSSHKRSASVSSAAVSLSSTVSGGSQPVQSSVFYEPPAGVGRWSDVHFPAAASTVIKQSAPNKPTSSTSTSPHDMQLTQTQR